MLPILQGLSGSSLEAPAGPSFLRKGALRSQPARPPSGRRGPAGAGWPLGRLGAGRVARGGDLLDEGSLPRDVATDLHLICSAIGTSGV